MKRVKLFARLTAIIPWSLFAINTPLIPYLSFSLLLFQLFFYMSWIHLENVYFYDDDDNE
jgi:hypothetical protein